MHDRHNHPTEGTGAASGAEATAGSIFVAVELDEVQLQRIRALAGNSELHFSTNSMADDETAFREAEIAFGPVPPAWISRSTRLRWLQLHSTGFDDYAHLDWDKLGQRVQVTNLGGFFAAPVAETALAGLLGLLRGIDRLIRCQSERRWRKLAIRPTLRTLAGSDVVIVGYGAIGRRFAELLAPFGCRVRTCARTALDAELRSISAMDAALHEADVVLAALPESPATHHLFDAARLERLKPSAILINVGRGSAVDEAALVERLRAGALGGAVLDVTAQEPLPGNHPLWGLPNVVLTQHTAGGSVDEQDRKINFFADNLRRYRQGHSLRSLVDWNKGY